MVWNSHLFQNFPQFLVIHTVNGFGIVNKAERDVFLELSCFLEHLAAKSLQLCPTVGPHRQQPTRLPRPEILQARILEVVAISFSNA